MIMEIMRFDSQLHYDELISCLRARDAYPTPKDELPTIGFVAFGGGKMIATAFLRRVEGGFAQLDGLMTNPSASSQERHVALDLVVDKLIEHARGLKIKHLIAFSNDSSTLLRSKAHGFVKQPYTMIAVDLK